LLDPLAHFLAFAVSASNHCDGRKAVVKITKVTPNPAEFVLASGT